MSVKQFSNNATALLAGAISNSATTLSVNSGQGALFPALAANQNFTATIMHIVSGVVTALEIVLATVHSTDTFTITRAQEGTTTAAWAAGDTFALLPTAGDMASFAQFDDLQAQRGNYAIDSGSANAYAVNLSPPLTALVIGMPVRFIALHANTSTTCTLNVNSLGAEPLVLGNSLATPALPVGAIQAGSIYEAYWTGSQFLIPGAAVNLLPRGIYKDANTVITNSSTLATDPDLQLQIDPGTYQVEASLFFQQSASGSAGIKIGSIYTGTATAGLANVSGAINGAAFTAAAALISYNNQFIGLSPVSVAGNIDWVVIKGAVVVSTGGTYAIQWAQENANAAISTTLLAGSSLTLTPINQA
jgi:hypothetical protein